MIFLNSKQELRSGWKFATYVVFFVLFLFATGTAISMVVGGASLSQNQLTVFALNEIALLVPAVGAMWLTVRVADRRPLRAFGIGFVPRWRRDMVSGLAMATAMLAVLVAGCYAFGYVSMRWTGGQVSRGTLPATLGLLMLAAANEELVFRGFPLQVLMEAAGKWPAVVGMSALFAALHLKNPNVSYLGIFNTAVAGILLSLAYAKTRSLWMPYAIHVVWNVGLGFVFGFRLSGNDMASLWTTGTAGSETILGGDYGPEGGLLATFIFAAAAVLVDRNGSIHPNQTLVGNRVGRPDRNRA